MFGPREDNLMVDFYYADAVYAPLYYGYGEPGSFSDRRRRAREWDHHLLVQAPDAVLVLVEASPSAIRERMDADQRTREVLKPQDVETVLQGFRRSTTTPWSAGASPWTLQTPARRRRWTSSCAACART